MISLSINGKSYEIEVDPETPILWVIRDIIGLTGTKFGCGIAQCGACTVHLDGVAIRSCVIPISAVGDKKITTIEGRNSSDGELHPVQAAWISEQVPQCGYCQPGQIMTAAALLDRNADPDDEDIDSAMKMNLCRCGTYDRIRKAIHLAAKEQK